MRTFSGLANHLLFGRRPPVIAVTTGHSIIVPRPHLRTMGDQSQQRYTSVYVEAGGILAMHLTLTCIRAVGFRDLCKPTLPARLWGRSIICTKRARLCVPTAAYCLLRKRVFMISPRNRSARLPLTDHARVSLTLPIQMTCHLTEEALMSSLHLAPFKTSCPQHFLTQRGHAASTPDKMSSHSPCGTPIGGRTKRTRLPPA